MPLNDIVDNILGRLEPETSVSPAPSQPAPVDPVDDMVSRIEPGLLERRVNVGTNLGKAALRILGQDPVDILMSGAKEAWKVPQGIGHLVKSAAEFHSAARRGDIAYMEETAKSAWDLLKAVATTAANDPGATARGAMDLGLGWGLGPLLRGDPEPFLNDPGGALVSSLFAVPSVAMPAASLAVTGVSAARRIPAINKALAPLDRVIGKIIPKYNWNDIAYGVEGERAGYLGSTAALGTTPAIREALSLYAENPATAEFLAPALDFGAKDLTRFHTDRQPTRLLLKLSTTRASLLRWLLMPKVSSAPSPTACLHRSRRTCKSGFWTCVRW